MRIGTLEVPPGLLRRTTRRIKPTCAGEMLAFLASLKRNGFDDTKCAMEKQSLQDCMKNLQSKAKPANTLNFHLQRLAKKV
ncbi:mitochondrial ribosomal protein S37 (mS37) [Andalucia godoyi]|uniref:Mitochondrial ribosomal protein S37 (MS37) n=1 Tax=Andalucia godoyi TaxID=505711 RepID=A0A8K0F4E2_ANDGO|nr:mitochondrial ribosomal protein S37 (mS37) [Andalucia godoyi]|eukprot:ANDGO_02863.mRNA.1 mitochondrial ribosomal protein S37 (mS37)